MIALLSFNFARCQTLRKTAQGVKRTMRLAATATAEAATPTQYRDGDAHSHVGQQALACFGAREKGTSSNHLTIGRDEVGARVLKALEEKLLNQELFEEFCDEFTRPRSNALKPAARS